MKTPAPVCLFSIKDDDRRLYVSCGPYSEPFWRTSENPLKRLSDKWLEGVPGPRFGGAQRRSGACSAPLSRFLGPASGPISIYQTVSLGR